MKIVFREEQKSYCYKILSDDLLVVLGLLQRPLLVRLDLLQVGHGRGVHGEAILKK